MDYSSSSLANGGVHASKTGSSSELYDEATPAFTNEATNPTSGRCIPSGEETDAASHLDDFSEHGRPKSEQAEERSSSAYGATKDDEQPNVARGEPSDDEDEVDDQYAALEARVKKAPKRLDQFTKYVHLMEDRVRYLEETLRKLEPEKPNILAEADQTNVATSNRVQPISELKYMRWGHFKNKYLGDREYAIEVLVGETKYWYQEQSETKLWEKKSQNDQVTNAGSESWTQTDVEQQKELPERIRINSSSIMTILSNIFSTSISEPVIFLRPYKLLVYYDSEIRQAFHRLESKWGRHNSVFSPGSDHKGETSKTISDQINPIVDTPEQSTTIAGSADSTQDNEFSAPANEQSSAVTTRDAPDDLADSLEAFRDLKCLIDFMDRHIAPVVEQLQSGARKCVRFNELWILFKPGELIYAPKKMDQQPSVGAGSSSSHQDRYQTLFKVLTVDGGRARLGPDPEKGHNNEDPPPLKDRVNPFKVYCYYVDFDGRNFSPAGHTFVIYPYEGERAITSLEAHPLRFAENHMTIRDELKLRGHKFKSVLNGKHMLYVGSTYTSDPNGGVEDAPKRTEYVNSEVIVDFAEADKLGSKWIYPAGLNWINRQIVATQFPDEFTETYYKNVWKDNRHKDYDRSFNETFFRDDNIDIRSSRVLVSSDPFLKAVGEMEAGFVHTTCDAVGDEETILLPSRVISYVLRDRKWAMLNVQNLRPIMSNSDGFKDLTLPSGHKEMVQALVRSHSMRRDGNATIKDAIEYDVVRGKGRGLIILLHGVPGVGKTSTAECIAQSTRKPLFPITCGDLGLTPKEVEESLQSVFQLAQAWDCVLLLDEADIFLAQRTKTDLKRNALVSGRFLLDTIVLKKHAYENSLSSSTRILHRNPIPNDEPCWGIRRGFQVPDPHKSLLPRTSKVAIQENMGDEPRKDQENRPGTDKDANDAQPDRARRGDQDLLRDPLDGEPERRRQVERQTDPQRLPDGVRPRALRGAQGEREAPDGGPGRRGDGAAPEEEALREGGQGDPAVRSVHGRHVGQGRRRSGAQPWRQDGSIPAAAAAAAAIIIQAAASLCTPAIRSLGSASVHGRAPDASSCHGPRSTAAFGEAEVFAVAVARAFR